MSTRTRKTKSIVAGVVTLVGAAMLATAPPTSAVQYYTATPLGALGGIHSYGWGINYRGQITGMAQTARLGNPFHAFLYTDGRMVDLGAYASDCCSYGAGINNVGHVTGGSDPSPEGIAPRAFLYADGNMIDLGTLGCKPYFMFPSGGCARGAGINDRGQVTGSSGTADGEGHAFLWSGGGMTDLGTLGGRGSHGSGINGSGRVAGWSYIAGDAAEHAFIYADGRMIDLGTLGGAYSDGYAINESGQVTGASATAVPPASHAFLYTDGSMIDLGTLGGDLSAGYGINNRGQVTGNSSTAAHESRAFLYTDGRMYDLNDLVTAGLDGARLESGKGINDRGQIVADGCTATVCQAYRLDPIAPPSAANYQGLWWNAPAESESGWGINFAHQGDTIFATWFTYDTTGEAWWLSMTANMMVSGVYEGTLLRTTGPAFNAIPFDPDKVTRIPVGSGRLTFADANNSTFAYTLDGVFQVKAITRQIWGPLPTCTWSAQPNLAAATNYQDLWWAANGAESGWGVNLTHQGDIIFATWFTYEFDGSVLWLSATTPKVEMGVYSGTLYRTTGPAFNAQPFDPNRVTRTPVGTLMITFTDGNAATFTYTMYGVTQTKAITREVFFPPAATVCSAPALASVTVESPTLSPSVGDFMQATATARDASGVVIPGAAPTWTSSNPGIATVSSTGLLHANTTGTVVVTATINGVSATQSLTIMPAMPVSVTAGATKEVVFSYINEHCDDPASAAYAPDFPDQIPRVVRAEDGSLVLFAGDAPRYFVSRGADFNSIKRDCSRPVLVSPDLRTPESYESLEWLWAVYREGSRWHAFIDNEFHDAVASTCQPGDPTPANPCWYNSVTYGVSTDGARSFTKPLAPAHVVAPPPNVWVPPSIDTPTSTIWPGKFFEGYQPPSNVFRALDGYYYASLFLLPSKSDPYGWRKCGIRTDRLDDPASWRAWDGSGFNLRLTSPYVAGRPGPLCGDLYGLLGDYYNTYLDRYIQVGMGVQMIEGKKVCGVYFQLSANLFIWSPPQLIVEAIDDRCEVDPQKPGLLEPVRVMFAALIDHTDTTVNFERPGRTPYLYYVRFNDEGVNRDVVRVPLTFTRLD